MRAIFIISARPAPTFKAPELWSADMVDFLGKCLSKNCDKRHSAEELMAHPWIKRTIRQIGSGGHGLPVLQDLIEEHWDEIERLRQSRFKVPHNIASEEEADAEEGDAADEVYSAPVLVPHKSPGLGPSSTKSRGRHNAYADEVNSDSDTDQEDFANNRTMSRSNSFGMPATRQQIRNASLSR